MLTWLKDSLLTYATGYIIDVVTVLDPIPTRGLTTADVDKLTLETRERMLEALKKIARSGESKSEAKKTS